MNTPRFTDRRLIWSADKLSSNDIVSVITCSGFPRDKVAIKLDRLFFTINSLDFINVLQDSYAIPVFVDAKIIEIPSKIIEITKIYLEHEPWMLNLMASSTNSGYHPSAPGTDPALKEREILYQFANACAEAGTLSCAVTVLTSKSPDIVKLEYGSDADAVVEFYAELMASCGMTDIVCSPLETTLVKQLGTGLTINTPGVRFADSSKDDQNRSSTPYDTIMNGSNRLVVGRDIYRVGQPLETAVENCNKILTEIERAEADLKKTA